MFYVRIGSRCKSDRRLGLMTLESLRRGVSRVGVQQNSGQRQLGRGPTPKKGTNVGALTRSRRARTIMRADWLNREGPAHNVSCTNGCEAMEGGAGAERASRGLLK